MFTTEDLKKAIDECDHPLVIKILAERDSNGVPLVDINAKYRELGSDNNAFYYALDNKIISMPILLTLLRIRDYADNLVLDIRHNGSSLWGFNTSCIMDRIKDAPSRLVLLNEIFNTRMADGKLRTHASKNSLWTAQSLKDYDCFQLLCKIQNIDKEYAPDINYLSFDVYTVLDIALMHHYANPSEENLKWIDAILQQGGLRASEVKNPDLNMVASLKNRSSAELIEFYRIENEPERLRKEQEARDAPEIIIDKSGMLKKKEIRVIGNFTYFGYDTMDENFGSLKALHNYYNKLDLDDPIVPKIFDYLPTFYHKMGPDYKTDENREKKGIAVQFLNCFVKDSQENFYGLTLREILALVWEGIVDNNENSFPVDIRVNFCNNPKEVIDGIITKRIETFIDKLNYIETMYGHEEPANGSNDYTKHIAHHLLQLLNGNHVAVYLIPNLDTIKSQANEMTVSTICWEFMNLSESEQRQILSSWYIVPSKAWEFKQRITPIIDEKLKLYFKSLLSPEERNNIVNSINDLPRPGVPNRSLNYTIDKFEKNYLLPFESSNSTSVGGLRKQLLNIYYDNSTNDTERFVKLVDDQLYFECLDNITKAFSTLKMEYTQSAKNQTPNRHRLKDIEAIESCIQNAYLNYQPDVPVKQVAHNLVMQIRTIASRNTILGFNTSNSSLFPLINQKLITLGYKEKSSIKGFFTRFFCCRYSKAETPVDISHRNNKIPAKS